MSTYHACSFVYPRVPFAGFRSPGWYKGKPAQRVQDPHITPRCSVGVEHQVLKPNIVWEPLLGNLFASPLCTEWGRPTGYIGFKSRIRGPGELIAPANTVGQPPRTLERYPSGSQVRSNFSYYVP